MEFLKSFFKEDGVNKALSLLLLITILISVKGILNLLLLTFIFSYLFHGLQQFLYKHLRKVVPVKEKHVTLVMYLLMILAIVSGVAKYVYQLSKDMKGISKNIQSFNINTFTDKLNPQIETFLKSGNVESYLKEGITSIFQTLPHVSEIGIQFLLAILLSFFFLLEKNKIKTFCEKIEHSKIGFLYTYYKYLGTNFANTFGKVLQIQILISFINAVISAIFLSFFGFHQVIGLGFMMFMLGLIAVVGAVISFIPLSIIAFTLGGIPKLIAVVVMIIFLHILESYVLNPKLMSAETKLPMFLAFLTLIISEHFLGTWGLLLGIPLLMFLLDLFGVKVKEK